MALPRRDFLSPSGCNESVKDVARVVDPVGIYSGMTKRLAITDGSHAPVKNPPRGTGPASSRKR